MRRAVRTSLAKSPQQVVRDERIALFRNNLVRSCWKPGLSEDEVHYILAQWEKKLIEAMHRWLHPELWSGFQVWQHRTEPNTMLRHARARLFIRWVMPCLNRWRSHSRILALGPFLYSRLLLVKMRMWRLEVAFQRSAYFAARYFPFRWLRRAIDAQRVLNIFLRSLRRRSLRFAYNTWCDDWVKTRRAEQLLVDTIRSWQSGLRRALNTWKGARARAEEMHLVAVRWRQHSIYRLLTRWARWCEGAIFYLRASLTRWLEGALSRAFNTWARTAGRRTATVASVKRVLLAWIHRQQVMRSQPHIHTFYTP